jgi:LAO/AO transport system kinase
MIAARRALLPNTEDLATAVTACDRWAVAASLNLLDDKRPEARRRASQLLERLRCSKALDSGHLIGLTGPPGAGKSSLTSALIRAWRQRGLKIGILAVDPSSPISGGALLGDRLRMLAHDADLGVFIRSLACRGEFGGLSAEVWPMSLLMLAAFDVVLVETVGVGQKEVDVSKMTDTTCFVAQPASGDSIQFLKAGIMEVPHILVVNKADMGTPARKTLSELRAALRRQTNEGEWQVPALAVSAAEGTGIEKLVDTLRLHHDWLMQKGLLGERRRDFQAQWVIKRLREQFGEFGLAALGGEAHLSAHISGAPGSPFEQYETLRGRFLSLVNNPG